MLSQTLERLSYEIDVMILTLMNDFDSVIKKMPDDEAQRAVQSAREVGDVLCEKMNDLADHIQQKRNT